MESQAGQRKSSDQENCRPYWRILIGWDHQNQGRKGLKKNLIEH